MSRVRRCSSGRRDFRAVVFTVVRWKCPPLRGLLGAFGKTSDRMQARSVLRAALYASLLTASCALKLSAVDAGVASVAKLRPTDNKDAFFTAAPR